MALPCTELHIEPVCDDAMPIHELDYALLKRLDLGLVYVQSTEAGRFAVTEHGFHRVQIYDSSKILDIASVIYDSGWTVRDEVPRC